MARIGSPSKSSDRRGPRFVKTWEELPPGEWLDNDDEGTNWYQTNDGVYWHSTDDGFAVWNEGQVDSHNHQGDVKTYDDEMYDDDDEEEPTKIVLKSRLEPPEIGKRSGVIGLIVSLVVLAWTFFGTIPATERVSERFYDLQSGYNGREMSQDIDNLNVAYETVIELSQITIFVALFTALLALLSFTKYYKWWFLPLSITALLGLLGYTAWLNDAAQVEWSRACNVWEDCPPAQSIWFDNSMIGAYCGGLGWLIIAISTLFALLGRERIEPDDDDEGDYDFYSM